MERIHTVAEFLKLIERDCRKEAAFFEKAEKGWVSLSHQEFLSQVKALAVYLRSCGVSKGAKVGILALPGIRWTIADLAIMSCGGVTVPLFANLSEENFLFECQQTELKILFVLGVDQREMYRKHTQLFEKVIALEQPFDQPLDRPLDKEAILFERAIEQGEQILKKSPQLFNHMQDEIVESDVATIIYTSGSTGIPKGVVLTHKNLFLCTYHNPFGFSAADRYLSLLPLAHIFGRTLNIIAMRWNMTIYYFNDLKELGTAAREVKPTFLIAVPRLLERVYAKMVGRVNEAKCLKRSLGQWAFTLANSGPSLKHTLLHPIADKMVYERLRNALGGHVRLVISGGAALNPSLIHFFNDVGIPIYEGFGMTEASISFYNTPENCKVGTVGQPDPQVEAKISPEGELLIRSDIVFKEYYQNHKKTAETIDKHGWLHTGDLASMDSEGFVTILGRVQELVKTSVGEWVAELPLEQELSSAPFIDFAMVVAEKRKFVSALIFPNFEVVESLKAEQGLGHLTNEEYLQSEAIQREMQKLLEKINAHHNHWEQIRDYRFVIATASIEGGELTPTLKIRRDFVQEKYKDLIKDIYSDPEK